MNRYLNENLNTKTRREQRATPEEQEDGKDHENPEKEKFVTSPSLFYERKV